jgi:hypothetical protein
MSTTGQIYFAQSAEHKNIIAQPSELVGQRIELAQKMITTRSMLSEAGPQSEISIGQIIHGAQMVGAQMVANNKFHSTEHINRATNMVWQSSPASSSVIHHDVLRAGQNKQSILAYHRGVLRFSEILTIGTD